MLKGILSHPGAGARPTRMRRFVIVLGLLTAAGGGWALLSPGSFSEFVNFPPHRHFVHDVGAFQLGIGATLLLAAIWGDAMLVAVVGYAVGGTAHTASHLADGHLGGSTLQTGLIAALTLLAVAAAALRWRARGYLVGDPGPAAAPALAPWRGQKTVRLTTFKRDGTPVGTAVSIAVDGDRAYVRSFEKAWKTRRIRNNPAVTVAPSTARGAATGAEVPGTARRLSGVDGVRAARALRRKYPLLHGVLVPLAHRLGRARTGRTVHFEVTLDG